MQENAVSVSQINPGTPSLLMYDRITETLDATQHLALETAKEQEQDPLQTNTAQIDEDISAPVFPIRRLCLHLPS